GQLHLVLADDRGEGVGVTVYRHCPSNVTDTSAAALGYKNSSGIDRRPAVIDGCQPVGTLCFGHRHVLRANATERRPLRVRGKTRAGGHDGRLKVLLEPLP